MDLQASGWQEEIDALSTVSGIEVNGYRTYIEALEKQRVRFRELGATATDHSTLYPIPKEYQIRMHLRFSIEH